VVQAKSQKMAINMRTQNANLTLTLTFSAEN